jgi:hypothetical protein
VAEGEQEIAWLNHATNMRDWERFIAAVRLAKPARLSLIVDDDSKAFPQETTEVPELKLRVAGKKGRLLIRWYKLTGQMRSSDWLDALLERRPPPLAIIGGNNSESALRLARLLQARRADSRSPLFLITQATSYNEPPSDNPEPLPLHSIYPGKTFRFCFTNRQMANSVTDFVWNRDNLLPASDPFRQATRFLWGQDPLPPPDDRLRPDGDPAYLPIWSDDPYSNDLANSFITALRGQVLRSMVLDWGWQSAVGVTGGVPINLTSVRRGQFHMPDNYRWQDHIPHSVGGINRPNHAEEQVANYLLQDLAPRPLKHPLLILPATSQACRRFLHGLRKNAPVLTRRFTVVTGDSIEFNKIYRDRNLSWPVQDLPLKLVFFCHRNPASKDAGFREESEVGTYDPNHGSPTSGTEDLLLFRDVVETVVLAAYQAPELVQDSPTLAANLHRVRWKNRHILFNANGNRRGGTGEHVVYLRPPQLKDGRVLPRAEIEVWSRTSASDVDRRKSWVLQRSLLVHFDGTGEGGLGQ